MCLGLEYVEMAFRYFKRASQKAEVSIGTLLNLVDMCIRDQRLEEAAEFLGRADHQDSRVLFQDAALRRAQGRPQEAETLFRDLLANPATSKEARIRALYELGGILDGAGQYDEAMAAWQEAKTLYGAHAAPFKANLQHMQSRAAEMEQDHHNRCSGSLARGCCQASAGPTHCTPLRPSPFRHHSPRAGARRAQRHHQRRGNKAHAR